MKQEVAEKTEESSPQARDLTSPPPPGSQVRRDSLRLTICVSCHSVIRDSRLRGYARGLGTPGYRTPDESETPGAESGELKRREHHTPAIREAAYR